MSIKSIVAVATLLAATAIASPGKAVVVNKCEYEVYLCNVPAEGGGYTEIDQTLSPNDTYSQQWTELSNTDGWSLKLSKDSSLGDIMQYEYTFHNDGTIWYDLSDVNGNPWDTNWEITAASESSTCSPKQQAYRYATDDAYGMQACPQDSVITVTLCSGESQDDGGAASASSSVAAVTSSVAAAPSAASYETPSSSVPTFTTTAAVYSSEAAPTTSAESSAPESTVPVSSASPTTFATSTTASSTVVTTAYGGQTVTEIATEVVTNVVTATHWWGHPHSKRDVHGHHARHNHA